MMQMLLEEWLHFISHETALTRTMYCMQRNSIILVPVIPTAINQPMMIDIAELPLAVQQLPYFLTIFANILP